jgi:hypothetical protein
MRVLQCDPETELIGQAMSSIVDNIQSEEIEPVLRKHNISEIDPQKWYKAQDFLNALNELHKSYGAMGNMVAVGMSVAEKMVTPPELANAPLPTILGLWNDLYHLQHRGGANMGYVKTEQLGETHYRTIHDHLYPDDFVYGLAYGMARRFLPRGTNFQVKYVEDAPRKDKGGDITVIDVIW